MNRESKIFFPNLDGLRFIAFFCVFFHHALISASFSSDTGSWLYRFVNAQKENGALGVNLFFVLSGFLITYLLISEKNKFKKIHVGNFYVRRILRIWPLYFLMVLAGFVIFPLIKKMMGVIPDETHSPAYYYLFISNFEQIRKGFADSSILNVLWSVGIEEQFYLVWPLVMGLTPRKFLLPLFALLIAGTMVFRFLHASEHMVIYYHTIAVFSDMVLGGIVAYLAFYNKAFLAAISKLSRGTILAIYIAGTAFIVFNYQIFNSVHTVFIERFLYSLFFAFVIAEQNFSTNSFYKLSNSKWLSRWGNYTYGLYCLHPLALLIAHVISEKFMKLHGHWPIMIFDFSFGLGLSMFLAWLSYRFYESPFLRLKKKFAYFTR